MNRLRQLLASARNALTRFDTDVAVWNRVVYGVNHHEYPVQRQQETNRSGFARRSSDAFLTGEELKARLLELA